MQRRLWRVCTFAQAYLGLRHSTEISCTGSNSDLCTVYKNSECSGEAAAATMAHLDYHHCVVSMRQKMLPVHCYKIPQYNVSQFTKKKKYKEVTVFGCYYM